MDANTALKLTHIGSVALSGGLFLLRGLWRLTAPEWLRLRWVRILPHLVDTILLGSAIALSWRQAQYPFVHGWLTAKVLLLVLYIGLGSLALKRLRSNGAAAAALLAALVVYALIILTALTHRFPPL
jgi:uncharacterized membrane protein SirB2